jgi:predicted nucleic acid-binding protein
VRRVVADTGPLLHLSEASAVDLLANTGEVLIPFGVDAELAIHLQGWTTSRPGWITVTPLDAPHQLEATAWRQAGLLGLGEAEAISLTRQTSADWLLTDDAQARLFARTLGLEVHGSLGVVLWAAAAGHMNPQSAEAALARLDQSSLWVSAAVMAEARAALAQLFAPP